MGVIGLLCAAPAAAQSEWVRVTSGTNNTVWLVRKTDAVNETNWKPSVWVKADASKSSAVKWRTLMSFMRFDCSAQSHTTLQDIQYSPAGETTYNRTYAPYEQSEIPTPPDTVIYAVAKKVCPSGAFP